MNILIIDDEANTRKLLALCLETSSHLVTAVSLIDSRIPGIESR